MRALVTTVATITAALLIAGCGGPKDSTKALSEACKRQIEQVNEAAHEGDTPTAASTEERLENITLVECAGQKTRVVNADEAEEKAKEEKAVEKDSQPASLDPAARTLFADTCGGCHTLSDAKATGVAGPDLDTITLDAAGVAAMIEKGSPAGMPAAMLTGADAEAVSAYVAAAAAAKK